MASAKETMNAIEQELARVRQEIDRLKIEEATLIRLMSSITGEAPLAGKRRIPNVKPLVLGIMETLGSAGGTSNEVFLLVRQKHARITRDSVASVLSRLKSADALYYDGERYFDARFAGSRTNDLLRGVVKRLDVAA